VSFVIENDVTARMACIYYMILRNNFVSGLICAVKPKKTLKTFLKNL